MKRQLRVLAVGMFALVVLVMPEVQASAGAPTPTPSTTAPNRGSLPPSGPVLVKTDLVADGFDAAVGAANGYVLRTAPDGRQYVTQATSSGPRSNATAQPDSTNGEYLTGSCGYSFIYFNGVGNAQGVVYTGFGMIRPAKEVHWVVDVSDSHGTGVVTSPAGSIYEYQWSTQYLTNNHKGFAEAEVSPTSYALMNNGVICHSLSPRDDTTIY